MGKSSARQKEQESKNEQNSAYLKGFDYLINNKQEKAVDKFIAFLNSKDPSFDSSIALGNLFRQRGEVDKAIAMHEKMANSNELEESENELAKLELAKDFISAGLLDRAENILLTLVEIPRQSKQAAKQLLAVYEREQDFKKAISVANEYSQVLESSANKYVSQYYCELAKTEILRDHLDEASSLLKKAIASYDKSLRARLDLAEIYIKQSKFADAYKLVKEVSILDPNSGIICLEKLNKCFPNNADPNYRYALEDLVHRTNSAEAMLELVKIVQSESGIDDAIALLQSFTNSKSNLKLLSKLLELRAHLTDAKANEQILQIKSLLDAQISMSNRYVCPNCGFESKVLFWQCPSCRKWESLKPKIGFDGD
ncbi:MAG: tetratricopeptide repeat protein [Succinivibrio sp.]|nr:tetratricopeptide repeat protein [Succinivibrio sp.]MEE0891431.1 tetratricopeptide repeat protein [Succinivibrio sp.]